MRFKANQEPKMTEEEVKQLHNEMNLLKDRDKKLDDDALEAVFEIWDDFSGDRRNYWPYIFIFVVSVLGYFSYSLFYTSSSDNKKTNEYSICPKFEFIVDNQPIKSITDKPVLLTKQKQITLKYQPFDDHKVLIIESQLDEFRQLPTTPDSLNNSGVAVVNFKDFYDDVQWFVFLVPKEKTKSEMKKLSEKIIVYLEDQGGAKPIIINHRGISDNPRDDDEEEEEKKPYLWDIYCLSLDFSKDAKLVSFKIAKD